MSAEVNGEVIGDIQVVWASERTAVPFTKMGNIEGCGLVKKSRFYAPSPSTIFMSHDFQMVSELKLYRVGFEV